MSTTAGRLKYYYYYCYYTDINYSDNNNNYYCYYYYTHLCAATKADAECAIRDKSYILPSPISVCAYNII